MRIEFGLFSPYGDGTVWSILMVRTEAALFSPFVKVHVPEVNI